jgi:cytochrome c-type biogenesis protein CcmH/NrfG
MPEPLKALGDLFLGARHPLVSQAIEAYSRAIDLRPFYAEAHIGLGDARAANGEADAAIAAYQKALTFDPFHAQAHLRLGKIYADTRRCGESLNAYRRAIELEPGSTEAHRGLDAISSGACLPRGP